MDVPVDMVDTVDTIRDMAIMVAVQVATVDTETRATTVDTVDTVEGPPMVNFYHHDDIKCMFVYCKFVAVTSPIP